jgi:hypothetical protein
VIIDRILAILIIGGGFWICQRIFRAFPLSIHNWKKSTEKSKMFYAWLATFAIILVQVTYIWQILSKAFAVIDSVKYIMFFMPFLIFMLFLFIFFVGRK